MGGKLFEFWQEDSLELVHMVNVCEAIYMLLEHVEIEVLGVLELGPIQVSFDERDALRVLLDASLQVSQRVFGLLFVAVVVHAEQVEFHRLLVVLLGQHGHLFDSDLELILVLLPFAHLAVNLGA